MYWTTEALTGNRELGFCSGEGAWETATTSKEGSRRVNYPILIKRGSDKKSQYFALGLSNCIENRVAILSINYWRASLVPAAAVIPAPIAYIKVVAVKKLVVGFLAWYAWPAFLKSVSVGARLPSYSGNAAPLTRVGVCGRNWIDYFEKMRVFKAG